MSDITRRRFLEAGVAITAAATVAPAAWSKEAPRLPYDEYARYDAMGLAQLVASGKASPAELLEAAIARTAAVDPAINAVVLRHFEQARAALEERVDYVAFGPLFGTTSKESEYDARGLEMLAEIAALTAPLPLVAIGGIDCTRIPALRKAGATAAAVISAVAAAADPEAATRALVAAFDGVADGAGGRT